MKKKIFTKVLATVIAASAAVTTTGVPMIESSIMQVLADEVSTACPSSALKSISISGVEEGASVKAYQLVKGVYSDNKLSNFVLTELGSNVEVGEYGNISDSGLDTVTLEDLVVFDSSAYKDAVKNNGEDYKIDGYTVMTNGSGKYAVNKDGVWYRVASKTETNEETHTVKTVLYLSDDLNTEFSNFLATYAGKVANKLEENKYTSISLNEGEEANDGTYTYSSDATVEPGLYLVTVSNSKTATIYNPVLVAVNVESNDDLSSGVTSETVSVNSVFKNGSLSAYTKKSSTGFKKKIVDENGKEVSGASAEAGTLVNFEISGMKIPSYSADYKTTGKTYIKDADGNDITTETQIDAGLIYEITDSLEAGSFGYIQDLQITVGDSKVYYTDSEGSHWDAYNLYVINNYDNETGSASLKISFTDKFIRAHGNQDVKVTYSARLLNSATNNFAENVNHAKLNYSSNPVDATITTTKISNTYHYTFGIDANIDSESTDENVKDKKTNELNKVTVATAGKGYSKDGTSPNALEGAVFGLYSDSACKELISRNEYYSTKDGVAVTEKPVSMVAQSDKDGHVSFTGLDEGTYYLKEITAPDGYSISDTVYEITINAEYNTDGTLNTYSITTVNTETNEKTPAKYTATYDNKEYIFQGTSEDDSTFSSTDGTKVGFGVNDSNYELHESSSGGSKRTSGVSSWLITFDMDGELNKIFPSTYGVVSGVNISEDDNVIKFIYGDYLITRTMISEKNYTLTIESIDGNVTPTIKTDTTKPTEITNTKNQTLPYTGGEGRFVIYIGSAVLAGAVIVLMAVKKKHDENEA